MIHPCLLFLLTIIISLPFLLGASAQAGAWLPPEKQYKLTSSVFAVDRQTRKLKKAKSDILLFVYRISNDLYREGGHRELTDSEKDDLEEFEFFCPDFNGFNDDFLISNEIDYGISQKQSIGLDVKYSSETNLKFKWNKPLSSDHTFKKNITKEASFYYKHSLFKNDRWQISLMPRISHHQRAKAGKSPSLGLEGYIGYSKLSKGGNKRFIEFGFGVTGKTNNHFKNTIIKKISVAEGYELLKGWFINNYSECNFVERGSKLKNSWIFEQISLAKELPLGNNKQQNINFQLGYYWKRSFRYECFRVSGPVFSIWLNI